METQRCLDRYARQPSSFGGNYQGARGAEALPEKQNHDSIRKDTHEEKGIFVVQLKRHPSEAGRHVLFQTCGKWEKDKHKKSKS